MGEVKPLPSHIQRDDHIEQLTKAGHSAAYIANLIGVTERTVKRARARTRRKNGQ